MNFTSKIFSSSNAGLTLGSTGMPVIFQKKGNIRTKIMLKKGKIFQNLGKNVKSSQIF